MTSLWTRGGLSWRELLRRIGREILADEVFSRSAELAYYFLFSLFPLLLFLTSLFGHVMGERADLRLQLFEYLQAVIPSQGSFKLVQDTLQQIIDERGLHFSLGLLFSLWGSSQGVLAVGRVLDKAYDVEKRRGFFHAHLVGIGLTVAFAALILIGLVLLFYGHSIVESLAGRGALGRFLSRTWSLLQWPVVLGFLVAGFELLYNFAPGNFAHGGKRRRAFQLISPGSIVGVGVWLAASLGLRVYLSRFTLYSWAYGTLEGFILLVLWFYITGFSIVIGGQVNAQIIQALGEAEVRKQREPPPPAPRSEDAPPEPPHRTDST